MTIGYLLKREWAVSIKETSYFTTIVAVANDGALLYSSFNDVNGQAILARAQICLSK